MDPYTAPHYDTSALITIDTQNDFILDTAPAPVAGTLDILPNMKKLLGVFRGRNRLIIHVVRLYETDGANADLCRRSLIASGRAIVAPGTPGAELADELKPAPDVTLDSDILLSGKIQALGPNEVAVYKPRWGAFYNTGLESFLADRGIDTLVFCGCNFPNCPRSSIYQASERDFRVILVSDAISQLYDRGVAELRNIGVAVLTTGEVTARMADMPATA